MLAQHFVTDLDVDRKPFITMLGVLGHDLTAVGQDIAGHSVKNVVLISAGVADRVCLAGCAPITVIGVNGFAQTLVLQIEALDTQRFTEIIDDGDRLAHALEPIGLLAKHRIRLAVFDTPIIVQRLADLAPGIEFIASADRIRLAITPISQRHFHLVTD